MKPYKLFLITGGVLLAIALGAGCYIWYKVQVLNQSITDTEDAINALETRAKNATQVDNAESSPEAEVTDAAMQTPDEAPATQEIVQPTVIDISQLSNAQREILNVFGISGEQFEVTQAMITCAEEAVGSARLNEIVNGSAPSPVESVKLLPCFRE